MSWSIGVGLSNDPIQFKVVQFHVLSMAVLAIKLLACLHCHGPYVSGPTTFSANRYPLFSNLNFDQVIKHSEKMEGQGHRTFLSDLGAHGVRDESRQMGR